jgi:DNA-directed RNA polymerase subunit L
MGSSSSVLRKLDYQYSNEYDTYEENKEETSDHTFGNILRSIKEEDEPQSAVWYSIQAVIETVVVIRSDLRKGRSNELYEVMKKVMINIDSIYDIGDTTFEYGKIQSIDDETLDMAVEALKSYYEKKPLITVKIHSNQRMVNLERFTYGIFTFKVSNDGYMRAYV